jgi:translation elongation factor EF-Tu-like GTPase
MDEPLFFVESTFRIRGRGLALVGITAEQYGFIKPGDTIAIHGPDGSVIQCAVTGVEYPPSVKWAERPACPRYGVIVDAEDVPVGSAVFVTRGGSGQPL